MSLSVSVSRELMCQVTGHHWSQLIFTQKSLFFSKIFQLTMNNWKQIFEENFNEDNIEKIAEH